LKGDLGCCKIVFLVDSGSTHNFISSAAARWVGVAPAPTEKMKMLVANGETLLSGGFCRAVTIFGAIWL